MRLCFTLSQSPPKQWVDGLGYAQTVRFIFRSAIRCQHQSMMESFEKIFMDLISCEIKKFMRNIKKCWILFVIFYLSWNRSFERRAQTIATQSRSVYTAIYKYIKYICIRKHMTCGTKGVRLMKILRALYRVRQCKGVWLDVMWFMQFLSNFLWWFCCFIANPQFK